MTRHQQHPNGKGTGPLALLARAARLYTLSRLTHTPSPLSPVSPTAMADRAAPDPSPPAGGTGSDTDEASLSRSILASVLREQQYQEINRRVGELEALLATERTGKARAEERAAEEREWQAGDGEVEGRTLTPGLSGRRRRRPRAAARECESGECSDVQRDGAGGRGAQAQARGGLAARTSLPTARRPTACSTADAPQLIRGEKRELQAELEQVRRKGRSDSGAFALGRAPHEAANTDARPPSRRDLQAARPLCDRLGHGAQARAGAAGCGQREECFRGAFCGMQHGGATQLMARRLGSTGTM